MIFDPTETLRYRKVTSALGAPGITLLNRLCNKCGNPSTRTVKVSGAGTSRHNPSKYLCLECK